MHQEGLVDSGGVRIDALDRPIGAGAARPVHFGDGDVEPVGLGIPHRLLSPIGGVGERDPIHPFDVGGLGEHAGLRIHLDQGRKRLVVGVVHGKEEIVLRIVGQLVGAQAGRATRGDGVDHGAGLEVDGDDPAVGVGGDETLMSRAPEDDDAIGAGCVVVAGEPGKTGRDLRDEDVVLGVDDVDDRVGAIGEVVPLGGRVDPADVEDEHLAAGIRRTARDGNGRYEPDRSPVPGFLSRRHTYPQRAGSEQAGEQQAQHCPCVVLHDSLSSS